MFSENKSLLLLQIILWISIIGICGWGFVNLSYRHAKELEVGDQVQAQLVGDLLQRVRIVQSQFATDLLLMAQKPEFVSAWVSQQRFFCETASPKFLTQTAPPNWASSQLESPEISPAGFPKQLVAVVYLAKHGLPEHQTGLFQKGIQELWQGSSRLTPQTHLALINALPADYLDDFQNHLKVLEEACNLRDWPEVIKVPDGIVLFNPPDSLLVKINQFAAQKGASVQFLNNQPQVSIHNQKWIIQKQRREFLLWLAISLGLLILAFTIFITTRTLMRVNEHRQRLVHSVSHEFRTPLAAILQFAELLAEGRVRDSEKKETYYHHIYQQAERLRLLIENVLTFARVEKRLFQIQKQSLEVEKFVENALEPFKRDLKESLKVNCWQNALFTFDPEALTTVLSNLLNNAKKYGVPPFEVSHGMSQKVWQLDVMDCGAGLPPKSAQKVFEAYTRLETDREGLGLGLNLCQSIIQTHGGTIQYLRHGGKTVFRIRMPGE